MILSIVIVNFNVRYFLEQCLHSIKKAVAQSAILPERVEVFIVDNASTDESVAFLAPLFPEFHFIANSRNVGFAKGNNQVLSRCSGEFVLFLNPDTIVAEDSLDLCIGFFREHAEAGALGVRMIDGGGRFLKESKRGFPGPRASFFKMTGLAGWFPSSRVFAAYYAGYLDAHTTNAVEVLSGAFMMVRKKVLDETGGFDEQFFMYAEDIDLSYRIERAGFKNYYFASTTIIHFKGESTPRDAHYVKRFHGAMNQFMKKYFHDSFAPFRFVLKLGVALRQATAALALRLPKQPSPAAGRTAVFIKAGPDDLPAAKDALQNAGMTLAGSLTEADALLYCEGRQWPLKSIIQEMDQATRKAPCFIHGCGTHAAVGSRSGRQRGETIAW